MDPEHEEELEFSKDNFAVRGAICSPSETVAARTIFFFHRDHQQVW